MARARVKAHLAAQAPWGFLPKRVADEILQEQAPLHPWPRGTAPGPSCRCPSRRSPVTRMSTEAQGGRSQWPCHPCLLRSGLLQGLHTHLPWEGLLGAGCSVRPRHSLWGQGTRGLAGGSGQV